MLTEPTIEDVREFQEFAKSLYDNADALLKLH